MRLYNANFSPNALRVRAVVHELGLEPEIVEIDMKAGDHRDAAYLRINPNGKVPLLVDGDLVLWESRAINAYLASLRPERGLCPADPRKRAVIDQWSYWQAIHLGPPMQKLAWERVQKPSRGMGQPDEAALAGDAKSVEQFLDVLEAALAGKEWIAGDLSIADFALASTFMLREAAGISLQSRPNVAAWIARMEARPSWQRAVKPFFAAQQVPAA